MSQTGDQVSVVNAVGNASIPRGAGASFGFQAAFSGRNPAPTQFALNGTPCAS